LSSCATEESLEQNAITVQSSWSPCILSPVNRNIFQSTLCSNVQSYSIYIMWLTNAHEYSVFVTYYILQRRFNRRHISEPLDVHSCV